MTPGQRLLLACSLATAWLLHALTLSAGAGLVLSARIVTEGKGRYQRTALVCVVPPDPDNRWLDMGIANQSSHILQLNNGERVAQFSLELRQLDCGEADGRNSITGYCQVISKTNETHLAKTTYPCLSR